MITSYAFYLIQLYTYGTIIAIRSFDRLFFVDLHFLDDNRDHDRVADSLQKNRRYRQETDHNAGSGHRYDAPKFYLRHVPLPHLVYIMSQDMSDRCIPEIVDRRSAQIEHLLTDDPI